MQKGSHWFTVAVGLHLSMPPEAQTNEIETEKTFTLPSRALPSKALASRATSSSSGICNQASCVASAGVDQATVRPQTEHGVVAHYTHLVDGTDSPLAKALLWAHKNCHDTTAASAIQVCQKWEDALAQGKFSNRPTRRTLCKLAELTIPCSQQIDSNKDLPLALKHVRESLATRICSLMPSPKKLKTLHSFFRPRDPQEAPPEIDDIKLPDVAIDVSSTYQRLHIKRNANKDNDDFATTINTLGQLRKHVGRRCLLQLTQDAKGTPKSIRRAFTVTMKSHFKVEGTRITVNAPLQHSRYMVTLRVLAQSRRWLSASERVDALEESPPTPKTTTQLAHSVKKPSSAQYIPFGKDFEDTGGYSPIIARLLFYAELHKTNILAYGSFTKPMQQAPYLYREVQEKILELRRNFQRDESQQDAEQNPSALIRCEEDLAAHIYDFAEDAIVAQNLVNFALPRNKRADAIVAKEANAPTLSFASSRTTTVTQVKKRPLTQLDASVTSARLDKNVAKTIARSFFKFVEKEGIQHHLSSMHAGQILVLSIFHSRLAWQKGAPIQLRHCDHYRLQKPTYIPACDVSVNIPSPAYFRQRIQESATQPIEPKMQAPYICCLCGDGFIDRASLRKHCDQKHHSWQEARKRTFWEAQQMDAIDEDVNSSHDWLFCWNILNENANECHWSGDYI